MLLPGILFDKLSLCICRSYDPANDSSTIVSEGLSDAEKLLETHVDSTKAMNRLESEGYVVLGGDDGADMLACCGWALGPRIIQGLVPAQSCMTFICY